MTAGFQCFYDAFGDLHVQDGLVCQVRTGVRIPVGSGAGFSATLASRARRDLTMVPSASGTTFVGGSGRNIFGTGLAMPVSGPVPPIGWFRPQEPGVYRAGIFTLTVTGASAATIHDGTDVVAELTTGGTAPVGDYDATAYGETTYNASAAFTIAMAAEEAGGDLPDYLLKVNAGSADVGTFEAVDAANYELVSDTDWTIVVDPSGSAELLYLTDVIAERAAGSPCSPEGPYVATALGMATYNLTAAEPVDGESWTAFVSVVGRLPRAGYVYLELIEDTGVLDAVNGPYFATALPADSGETYYFPLAQSDGTAMEQFHIGALVWA